MDRSAEFGRWKTQSLSKADLSRKGSVDEGAVEVVELLNSRDEFFTTSSCAGRILLLDGMAALNGTTSDAVLKFEPFILHVQCRTLQDAQLLAVRSTHGLEVPLSHKGKLMVTEEYIEFLLTIANKKMEENKKRIGRFYNCLQHAMEREAISNPCSRIKEKNNPRFTHKNERNQGKRHDLPATQDSEKELAEDGGLELTATLFQGDD
ncbi:tRNA wybutosine-synthesizing protein 3 homolog isoform X4 [Acomys russatus]|uniref:tRNA wybutosine-synthesizing protein 3 homolog isoform X4 n=1 Tax=Acomys russatus TaxID=60746 RepID=UPI0021E25C21|nr:tRNA wybutosine-synthesizing protein 3 homolog isoform X4 [Acomys russatus]